MRPLPIAAFFVPIISAPSGRGLVPILLIVGMWAFIDICRHRRATIKEMLLSPLSIWIVVAAGLALISANWALVPEQSIKVGLSFAGLAIFGLVMLHHAKRQSKMEAESTQIALIVGMSIAITLLAVGTFYGLTYDQPLWGKENQHPIRTLSHAQTIISIFLMPCLAVLWERGTKARIYAGALLSLAAITFINLEHGASNLAILVAIAAYILVRITGKSGILAVCCAVPVAIISMPYVLSAFIPTQEALSALGQDDGGWSSVTHRFHMWRFVTDIITNEFSAWGFGADASRTFPGANEKIMWGIELMPLHPHNGALQIWLELGVLGLAMLAIIPVLIFRRVKDMPNKNLAISAALLSAFMVPWLLSYGVWQSWWLALAWLTAAIGCGLSPYKKV